MKYIAIILFTLFTSLSVLAQTGKIEGMITDENGEALPFVIVSVDIEEKTIGVTSDFDGKYSIALPVGTYLLKYSFVGYETLRIENVYIKEGEVRIYDVVMKASSSHLEEVVITGGRPAYIVKHSEVKTVTKSENITTVKLGKIFNKKKAHPPVSCPKFDGGSNDVENHNRESYEAIKENRFLEAKSTPLSTFSIDVDAASYTNVRRMLNDGQMPSTGAVRIEEMVNYFTYDYPQPQDEHPFAIHTELGDCPWNADNYLLHIGLQGKQLDMSQAPANNLVFLLDVSGSMNNANKLPLVKKSLKLLMDQMRPEDKVAIVVYAGSSGLVLPSTSFNKKGEILQALEQLKAGGSTAGGAGIQLAYKTALDNFIKNGNNRVILCTDGDFNVGVSSDDALVKLIEEKRNDDVFLSILGFGRGNYQDQKMEKLSNAGNGNYAYIDNLLEAQKVLVSEMGGTLLTIAKDVKIQIEFNPAVVQSYRLIGYENRMLESEDFNDDKKDAGELGAGHTVTALYEIVPVAGENADASAAVDPLKYQESQLTPEALKKGDWATVKFRYKPPTADESILLERVVTGQDLYRVSNNFRFSASVAYFGMLLRESEFTQKDFNYEETILLAKSGIGLDEKGYRKECIGLMKKAKNNQF